MNRYRVEGRLTGTGHGRYGYSYERLAGSLTLEQADQLRDQLVAALEIGHGRYSAYRVRLDRFKRVLA